MIAHKLAFALLAWCTFGVQPGPAEPPSEVARRGVATAPLAAERLPEPRVPSLGETQRSFLSRVARRTVRNAVLHREPYEVDYVPADLATTLGDVVVRLRQEGYLLALGTAGPAPVVSAVRDAALSAVRMLAGTPDLDEGWLNGVLLEIEVAGPGQPIPVAGDWTRAGAIDAYIEPGVHGLTITGPRGTRSFTPNELLTSDLSLPEALAEAARQTHAGSSQLGQAKIARFRTQHWYQTEPGGPTVSLHRGMVLVRQDAVSSSRLSEVIERLARYIAYRQTKTGSFTYLYEPGRDRYAEGSYPVRECAAVMAMALDATRSARSGSLAAADLALRSHLSRLTPFPGATGASFIATPDATNDLGLTALVCIAQAQHPHADLYATVRSKLVGGMLALQQPSGMFVTAFPPARGMGLQDYFPGEALLALAMEYDRKPSAEIVDAFGRAIEFYRAYFREARSPSLVPWQTQAFAIMARHTKRADYTEYVFMLNDWLVEFQLGPENCSWPELWGGFAPLGDGRPTAATASYLEGLCAALTLARHANDEPRAARYESAVRHSARFVVQLQVRAEEAYYMLSPLEAVGGIRSAPALNRLRIDHAAHALLALTETRRVLFPDEG